MMQNRYVQLLGLTLGLAILIGMVLWLVAFSLGALEAIPLWIFAFTSLLAAGVIVSRYFANRIA